MMDLDDKTALITGGGRGIGRAIAFRLRLVPEDVIGLITYVREHEADEQAA